MISISFFSFKNHFILKCFRKRNYRKGIIWNLKGDEEDFSFVLKTEGGGELLPFNNQELSSLILDLLHKKITLKQLKKLQARLHLMRDILEEFV